MLDQQWDGAIRDFLERTRPTTVFVERREDLTVVGETAGYPTTSHTIWTGACVERPEQPLTFHSDLKPDQLADLVSGESPVETARHGTDPLWLDAGPAVATLGGAIVEAQKRLPDARVTARWVEFRQEVKIGGKGLFFADCRSMRRLRLDAVAGRNGRHARAAVECVVRDEGNYISSLLAELGERVEARLEAIDPPSGRTRVVFAPAVGGIWIHELVGHAAEADVVRRGASWLTPDVNGLDDRLTVIDDPRRARASWNVDDEGTTPRPVALIREGRPREYLHSVRTASESGEQPTGHGRRSSYREAILPRMGCTFIANGDDDPDEILQNVQQGVYVRRMESAHTDPRTGRALFRVTDADRIVDGRLDVALKPFLLETVGRQALAAIESIGNDLAFDRCIGSCHRQGQPLSTSVGAPTICTGLMTVRI
ncbi:MAG: hypothetical protein GTN89_06990 [Acidobacteria bacterium]|nr:hypothetical protein [Acidobacteriota bacterium]NIM62767.1 hypothetical protein [Acidobacteriota bacterium]NIO59067.1 hypothetical protein [Acidobacteriota bacterium]NIQ30106.1 hypothetical protein [Acidobacteriota bacterium]NIQ84909.1 hypothetical protein [Acidobacteriota bacterium]